MIEKNGSTEAYSLLDYCVCWIIIFIHFTLSALIALIMEKKTVVTCIGMDLVQHESDQSLSNA